MSYSGWTNYETWAVNQQFGETFSNMGADEQVTPAELRETIRETFILSKLTPLEREFMTMSMSRVDWEELAEAYQPDYFLVDEY